MTPPVCWETILEAALTFAERNGVVRGGDHGIAERDAGIHGVDGDMGCVAAGAVPGCEYPVSSPPCLPLEAWRASLAGPAGRV